MTNQNPQYPVPTGTHHFTPSELDFDKMGGLAPFVLQHAYTHEVLMVGFLNQQAWETSCKSGILTLYRRTLNRVWVMGEDDGQFVAICRAKVDCDNDTVLFETTADFPICGHGFKSCFYTELPVPVDH